MISIITPSFNRSYIIDETAQSIFAQSNRRWEWIIVDDGSTDDSWGKIQAYAKQDDRVKAYRRNREPKGACTCRNIGVEKARGSHLIFLDTDDLLGPDAISERKKVILEQKAKTLAYFPTVTFENKADSGFYWDDAANPVSWLTGLFTMTPPCQGTAPVWPREEFKRIGGWREDLRVWQDIELHIRAFAKGIRFEPAEGAKPDIFLRLSPDSISHVNFHSPEKVLSRWKVVQSCLNSFVQAKLSSEETKALQTMVLGVFQNMLNLRNFEEAKAIIERSSESEMLTKPQILWMKSARLFWQFRLYKIGFLNRRMDHKKTTAFPFRLHRKLGVQKWQ